MPPITTGSFEDLVQLSQDTLYYVGPDLEIGNTSVGTSATLGFNGTGGNIALVGAPTGNVTINLPSGGGTLLTNVNVSAGTTSQNLSAIVFSNSNGVSFGLSGSTITGSAAGGGGGGGIDLSAGTQTATSGTVVFSNSNNVSFGMSNSSVVTATVASSLTAVNLSAGTTSNNLSEIVFSNTNNVSFGLNASTVTASANLTGDWYDNIVVVQPSGSAAGAMGSMSNFTASVSTLFVTPLHGLGLMFPFDITANTVFFPDVSISGSTATMSIAFTSIWRLGIYTLNGSSLSLLNSASFTFGFAGAATNNSTAFAGGYRYLSASSNVWSSSPVFRYGSRYWLGWFWSSAGALNQTGDMAGEFIYSTGQRSGLLGVSNLTATSNGAAPFYGIYSAQTAALPGSIGSNQLQKTASIAGFVPHLIFANNAAITIF
jgi:hypothetical protein